MVQITIDTKKDSVDEIRNTIRYLQSIVGESPASFLSDVQETPRIPESSFEDTADAFSMFESTKHFPTDEEAPSDYTPENKGDDAEEETFVEIVEY